MSGTLAIPASSIVNVTPSVISAGGNALDLSGMMLTTNRRVPIGTVLSFPSQASVAQFFGASSQENILAANYFLGFDNSNQKPGAMLFAQYNQVDVGAWLRGAPISSIGLAALQAMSGSITVSIDGTPVTSGSINLSAANSFSNAAEAITQALGIVGPTGASFTGSISNTTLTVSSLSSGVFVVGQEVRGSNVTPGTVISNFGPGTNGGTGTYTISIPQAVSSETMTTNRPVVTFDSVTGAFYVISSTTGANSSIGYGTGSMADSLGLSRAAGATFSQGAVAASPTAFMTNIVAIAQNWASFSTMFDPDAGSGNAVKQQFAAWVNTTVDRYVYVAWDTDVTPTLSQHATTSLGNILQVANSNGTVVVYSPGQGPAIAAFVMGLIASVDFTETNGRATAKFKSQTGIVPDVVSQSVSANLLANGYNFYGSYATANEDFNFFADGTITGPFKWIDSYIDQIWLNNQFQLALMVLLTNVKSIPYNQVGYGLIRAALMDPINQGLNFGAFRPGVTLSQAQIAEVNNSAGKKIDDTLSTQGWYIVINDALPQVRVVRGSPAMTVYYMDGQSIQKLSLASVEVE